MEEIRDSNGYPVPARDATPRGEKSPPKSPAAVREKRHVSGPMKFVVGEKTRATALEGVDAWRKKFATEPKWKSVLSRIKKFTEEDDLRLSRDFEKTKKEKDSTISKSSARKAPWPGQQTRPPNLTPAASFQSPTTPRARWDIPAQGPITPLSSTPTGNAFSPGGFWESLSPAPTTPVPFTPITAIPLPPRSPVVPRDPAARAAYEEIAREVELMALKLCASRLSIYSTSTSSSEKGGAAGLVHPSMVKPKDELAAAEFVLQSKRKGKEVKLESAIDPHLPEKMRNCAQEEGKAIDTYSIQDSAALGKVETWLQLEPKSLEITTILDAQRDVLSMLRHRRKSKEISVSDAAVRLAWATRILEDKEAKVAGWDGGSVESEEEGGYDYGNFLRSLKREGSEGSEVLSERWSVGDLKKLRERSGTVTTGTSASLSARESVSPKKALTFEPGSGSSVFGSAPWDDTGVLSAGTPMSGCLMTPTPLPRASDINISLSRHRHRHRHTRSKNLSISTTSTAFKHSFEDEQSQSPLSPEDKEFRHQGPSHADLKSWAEELKKLRSSVESSRSGSTGGEGVHPAFRSSSTSNSNFEFDSMNPEDSSVNELERGRNRNHHQTRNTNRAPDRNRNRDSQCSSDSWRCISAASVEREARSVSRAETSLKIRKSEPVRASSRAGSHVSERKEEEEDEWARELQRMESREVMRQKWG